MNKLMNRQIAANILSQLGGGKFLAMTGSNNIRFDSEALYMNLRKNQSKASFLKIEYDYDDDLYLVSFMAIQKFELVSIKTVDGVYHDMLPGLFTSVTGFDTHL